MQKISKKLPKRVSNERSKARRAASWQRCQLKKEKRRKEQAEREKRNRELRAQGLPTPHEAKKKERKRANQSGV